MEIIGSQRREKLSDTEYKLIERRPCAVVLEGLNGCRELWVVNNYAAGYVIQIGRWGYEFVRSVPVVGQ